MKRIYLACAREDKAPVQGLFAKLQTVGFEPCFCEEQARADSTGEAAGAGDTAGADVFLICLSSLSVAGIGRNGCTVASAISHLSKRVPGSAFVLPVKLDECTVPELPVPNYGAKLGDLAAIDLSDHRGFDRLVMCIRDSVLAGATRETGGSVFRDAAYAPDLVVVPSGSFVMGSPADEAGRLDDEGPQHEVTFEQSFALGRYAVTFDEYDRFARATGRRRPNDQGWGRGRRPVIDVSWKDATAYADWLSRKTRERYRLPTEAEWEYACRAGSTTPYFWGQQITSQLGNYCDVGYRKTVEVGHYPANSWGLHDMHGNVWEWCGNVWHDNYNGVPLGRSATSEDSDSRRSLRGGSWMLQSCILRSASRNWYDLSSRLDDVGFRVAKSLAA